MSSMPCPICSAPSCHRRDRFPPSSCQPIDRFRSRSEPRAQGIFTTVSSRWNIVIVLEDLVAKPRLTGDLGGQPNPGDPRRARGENRYCAFAIRGVRRCGARYVSRDSIATNRSPSGRSSMTWPSRAAFVLAGRTPSCRSREKLPRPPDVGVQRPVDRHLRTHPASSAAISNRGAVGSPRSRGCSHWRVAARLADRPTVLSRRTRRCDPVHRVRPRTLRKN